jgi:hypothetical protein
MSIAVLYELRLPLDLLLIIVTKIGLGSEHVLRNITIIEKSKNDSIITIKSFPTLSSDPIQGFMENGTFSLTV